MAQAAVLRVGRTSCLPLLLLVSSCSKTHEPPPKASFKESPAVATVGDEKVTFETLQVIAAQNGYNLAHKEEAALALRDAVNLEILAAEAAKLGYDQDPDIRRYVKSQAVQKLLAATVDSKGKSPPEPSEAEMKDYYETNLKEFTPPTLARAQVLALLKRKGQEESLKAKVGAVKKAVEEAKTTFSLLVKQYSDDPAAKNFGGTTNWLVKGEPNKQYPSAVMEAVFQPGDAVAGPIEHNDWIYFVKTVERRESKATPFEQAKLAICQRLQRGKRLESYDGFVNGLKKDFKVETWPEQVEDLVKAATKQGGPPTGPVRLAK